MKKLILFSLILAFSLTCIAQKSKWKKAQKVNTIESYQGFIMKFPESQFSKMAKAKLDSLKVEKDWDVARETDTRNGYEKFLKKHSNSQYVSNAKNRIEKIDYQAALSENTIEAYEEFLDKYGSSQYVSDIKIRIEKIEWKKAIDANNIEAYEKFLNAHKNSSYSYRAQSMIESLAWERAVQINNTDGYSIYLEKYPKSTFTKEATKRLSEIKTIESFKIIKVFPTQQSVNMESGVFQISQFGAKPKQSTTKPSPGKEFIIVTWSITPEEDIKMLMSSLVLLEEGERTQVGYVDAFSPKDKTVWSSAAGVTYTFRAKQTATEKLLFIVKKQRTQKLKLKFMDNIYPLIY